MLKFIANNNNITSTNFIQASFSSFLKSSEGLYGERFICFSNLSTDIDVCNFIQTNKGQLFTIENYEDNVITFSLSNVHLINSSIDAIGKTFKCTFEK